MQLLIVLITYNRLAYTKKTLRNLWFASSDTSPYYLMVVDNNSTDGTQEYVKNLYKRARIDDYILNKENYYPGKACNIGWEKGLKSYFATHLMRLDNDMILSKGWDRKVAEYFKAIPELGQLGLEHEAIETPEADSHKRTINGMTVNEWPGCVGGPMVMPVKFWEQGVRYDETPWHSDNPAIPTAQEDSKISQVIKQRGYLVGHAQEELGRTFANKSNWSEYPEYYRKTMSERGYQQEAESI